MEYGLSPALTMMKLSLTLIAFWLAMALGQTTTVCTAELASTDDCADVINPIACYNQFGFSGTRTLSCIDGKTDAERSRKARHIPSQARLWTLLTAWCRRAIAAAVWAPECAPGLLRITSVTGLVSG